MSRCIIVITDPAGFAHHFDLEEGDDLTISMVHSEEHELDIAGITNEPDGVQLGTWNRSGDWVRCWDQRYDS